VTTRRTTTRRTTARKTTARKTTAKPTVASGTAQSRSAAAKQSNEPSISVSRQPSQNATNQLEGLLVSAPESATPLPADEQPKRSHHKAPETDNVLPLETESDPAASGGASSSGTKRRSHKRKGALAAALDPSEEGELHAALVANFMLGGGVMGTALPVTGRTLIMRAEQNASAVLSLARVNPAVLKWVRKLLDVSVYTQVAQAVGTIAIAVAVDVRAMAPESTVPQMLIPDVLATFADEPKEEEQQPAEQTENLYASSAA
jgi:hypothetical protein